MFLAHVYFLWDSYFNRGAPAAKENSESGNSSSAKADSSKPGLDDDLDAYFNKAKKGEGVVAATE